MRRPLCAILFFLQVFVVYSELDEAWRHVSPSNSLAWGPGLKADIVLPARYFFIQAVDRNGNNFTDSVGLNAFTVSITKSADQSGVRAWIQVLDRQDGSYIVRYKLMESAKDLRISIFYNGKEVANSPYFLKGNVYHEQCNCPLPSMTDWMKRLQCPSSYEQITRDLSLFRAVDMKKVSKDLVTRFSNRGAHSLCHYVIKDNKIYRQTHGQHVGFKMFMDELLLSMTRKVVLPDLEFFVNLGDWPLESRAPDKNPVPLFSWCGSDDTRDIVMPTYDIVQSTLETMNRVSLDMLSVQNNTGPKWQDKKDQAFWRGRDSRQERLDLVKMSHKHPDLLDARLTRMFFFPHTDELGPLAEHISFYEFFKYKYQLNIDGTVAAYRLPYLLAGDSVVLKQESKYYEHFYKQLKPYEHYIPVKADLSNLLEQIEWAKANDNKAQQIARNAQMFVRDNLLPVDIYCYHAVLFEEYSKLLLKPAEVEEGMELVSQPSEAKSSCKCDTPSKHTEL